MSATRGGLCNLPVDSTCAVSTFESRTSGRVGTIAVAPTLPRRVRAALSPVRRGPQEYPKNPQPLGENVEGSELRKLVDRVYKGALPEFRTSLERLRDEFSRLRTRTNWARLRVEPLLKHVEELDQRLGSREFSRVTSRLTNGVRQFHSDLVYLRENVKWLEEIVRKEKRSLERRVNRGQDRGTLSCCVGKGGSLRFGEPLLFQPPGIRVGATDVAPTLSDAPCSG